MSVIHQLQQIYPSMRVINEAEAGDSDQWDYFLTPEKELIAIPKIERNNQEAELLSIFLTPFEKDSMTETERETAWKELTSTGSQYAGISWPQSYRFILFTFDDTGTEKSTIKEALQSLFPERVPLIWQSDRSGYIVEEIFSSGQEVLSFEGIPDVLMSDFYTNIRFFTSHFSSDLKEAPSILKWSLSGADLADRYHLPAVASYKDIIPYFYIDYLPEAYWHQVEQSIFQEVLEDKELLQTIKVFLETGSNTSLAAKKLYMHRNSMQYRVDKFIEKTDLDIKDFKGAVITYLALLHLQL
ncbi:helix-turn-helix domain-containing protein [Halobacillus kuroshimensis]|uniref:Helix-turn-helix domain-containing protein n=1 Tax=Halobacillus kuroshimensis TaxID=302481 RepID=A0ABS3DQL2_9BACI|nr:helix-turn-helix domain-containing protein [Halobacillus kuroshimensis]MBN8233622.1 helix-turn-helix domain-containing protein [Halobacillus kuroshimensis]